MAFCAALVLLATAQAAAEGVEHLRRDGSRLEDTPVFWWCNQAGREDSPVCKKLRFKSELRSIDDPAERARVIAERRDEAMVRPSPEQLVAMRSEEREMLAAFCALPEKADHPFCARESITAMRGHDHAERDARERLTRHGVEERPIVEYDKAVEWFCRTDGTGHADGAANAASSMICASWRYRSAMHGASSHGDAAERKAAIVDEYRKVKEAHREVHDIKGHMAEQQRMLAEFCALEEKQATKLCVKHLARARKTELRRELAGARDAGAR
ncbi:hypothetical protein KFE25_004791 [Diacronema lutheri]|uniref:Uncharacterized protein n=2 Tax=Diacronema lutheri TaxID=2081491 RepID=A0A8J6CB35_DIALT|nr:hypothetical protein KFE25_004791 [Diacronema lutheri]